MSSYGVAVIADVPDTEAAEQTIAQLKAATEPIFGDVLDDVDIAVEETDDGARLSFYAPFMILEVFAEPGFDGVGPGRAVVADDADEHGVTLAVWELTTGPARLVYQTHIDYPDAEPAPTADGSSRRLIQGQTAAEQAAALFGGDPQPFLDIEDDPSPVVDNLGTIGTPFDPWLTALGLNWPVGD
ncbi:hypothetical protein [Gordonia crocea]|uniref:Uncharacterized protein n=1 Tax=Gordonia crocea TaxID=589162 RepID=A0A7I9V1I2_9ACTN|nr:hypothetical protein [Gordonia crocea]GED98869.1 hypothetical protein nbrc107697_29080 [Gordonia crocea]